MTDGEIPDETDETTGAQDSWTMRLTTCQACQGRGAIQVAGRDLATRQQTTIAATCATCGGTGRVLRRERSERSGGNG